LFNSQRRARKQPPLSAKASRAIPAIRVRARV